VSTNTKPVYVTEQDEPIAERVIATARFEHVNSNITAGPREDGKLRRARVENLLSETHNGQRYQALHAAQNAAAGHGADWTRQPKVRREIDSIEIEELPGNRVRVIAEYAPVPLEAALRATFGNNGNPEGG